VPGSHVPITPKLGISPNIPPGRVNPPNPGRVTPHKMTDWHPPKDNHVQRWPTDTYHHEISTEAWKPTELKHVWEPAGPMKGFLTTDMVDGTGLLQAMKTNPFQDLAQTGERNQHFDFSTHNTVDSSVTTHQNASMAVNYDLNLEQRFEPHSDSSFQSQTTYAVQADNSTSRVVDSGFDTVVNDHSSAVQASTVQVAYDLGSEQVTNVSLGEDRAVQNDYSQNKTAVSEQHVTQASTANNTTEINNATDVRYEDRHEMLVDSSRSVQNDFSRNDTDVTEQHFANQRTVNNVSEVNLATDVRYEDNLNLNLDYSRDASFDFSESDTDVYEQHFSNERTVNNVSEVNNATDVRYEDNLNLNLDYSHSASYDFSESMDYQAVFDNSTTRNVENVYNNEHQSLVNFVENRTLAFDDSRTVANDFSEDVDLNHVTEQNNVRNTDLVFVENRSPVFEFDLSTTTNISAGTVVRHESGGGGVLSTKS
jgi:hypothetical protein